MNDMENEFQKAQNKYEENIVRVLKFMGEKAINEARENGNYKDRTANLRNSIGYMITINGVIVQNHFSVSLGGKEAQSLAKRIASGYSGIVLVVVAGMNYALYVESKGRNVLTSAEQLVNRELPLILKQLNK